MYYSSVIPVQQNLNSLNSSKKSLQLQFILQERDLQQLVLPHRFNEMPIRENFILNVAQWSLLKVELYVLMNSIKCAMKIELLFMKLWKNKRLVLAKPGLRRF